MASGRPRAHHFVPRCWLAGFTDTGTKEGKLLVTDLTRANQWFASPANTGHQRDFYRVDGTELDPVVVEKELSRIEDAVAPILRAVDQEQREPTEEELKPLLWFMAIQWVRVPAFRPVVLEIADRIQREQFDIALRSPESWVAWLSEAGIDPDIPGADYQGMLEFHRSGQYSLAAETGWYLQRSFNQVEAIARSFEKRHWTTSISPSGSFIGSDNPVSFDGPKGQMAGYGNAECVAYPVSRHVLLCGTREPIEPPFLNRYFIASMNTMTMLRSDSQVYSNEPDFCWLDETRNYQTDWKLFSKEKFQ